MCFLPDIIGHQGITFGIINCPEQVFDSTTVFRLASKSVILHSETLFPQISTL